MLSFDWRDSRGTRRSVVVVVVVRRRRCRSRSLSSVACVGCCLSFAVVTCRWKEHARVDCEGAEEQKGELFQREKRRAMLSSCSRKQQSQKFQSFSRAENERYSFSVLSLPLSSVLDHEAKRGRREEAANAKRPATDAGSGAETFCCRRCCFFEMLSPSWKRRKQKEKKKEK